MPTELFPPVVLGAAIGAAASLLGGVLLVWRQAQLEEQKWLRARADLVRADTRIALSTLAKCLASTTHSMMWFTYKALSQGELSDSDLSKYELEFHESVSNLVGSQMLIAALDHSLYERVTPLVSEAIELGGNTYVALKSATEDATAAEAELSDANAKALALIKKVPHDVANLLRSG